MSLRFALLVSACALMACSAERGSLTATGGAGGSNDGDAAESDAPFDVEQWARPNIQFPQGISTAAFLLSDTGLYQDIASKTLAPDLIEFAPSSVLWSDGAEKQRWLHLPPGTQIATADMDNWHFPVGTLAYKQFSQAGRRLETRLIAKIGEGRFDYWMGAFVWFEDESDAALVPDGSENVRGTQHDVPSQVQCGSCHNGEPGRLLGFSAIQLSSGSAESLLTRLSKDGLLSDPPPEGLTYPAPGDAVSAPALGYLHANCAHCHNPGGIARPDTDMNLELEIEQRAPEQSNAYLSAVNVALQFFDDSGLSVRIEPGSPERSGIYYRMTQRGMGTQMPPLATEIVHDQGLELVRTWIEGL